MIETVITLKPEAEWRPGLTPQSLEAELDALLQLPGVTNTWTMPIKGRIDMLSTGIRTPVGIKIFGPDLRVMQALGEQIEQVLGTVEGTRNVLAERVVGGYFLDFEVRRADAARYGLNVEDVEAVVETAVGGKNITQTIEGRERYPVNVRYARELRDDLESLRRVLVATPTGAPGPDRPARRHPAHHRPAGDQERGRPARRLRVRRRRRPRHRLLRGRGAGGCRRERRAADRLLHCDGAASTSTCSDAPKERLVYVVPLTLADHLPAAVPELRVGRQVA